MTLSRPFFTPVFFYFMFLIDVLRLHGAIFRAHAMQFVALHARKKVCV